jgi:hypothetical protein
VAEKGGGAVFISGPRYMPWDYGDVPEVSTLLPFDCGSISTRSGALPPDISQGFVVRPTPLGLKLPPLQLGDTADESAQIWRNLPPMFWMVEIDQWKPAAQLLAEHPSRTNSQGRNLPLVVGQFVGAGKVWFHATDSTWRWRVGVGDVYFARYWVQTIRYLARGKLMVGLGAVLTTDRREYLRGEPVQVRLRFLDERLAPDDDEVIALLQAPGEARRNFALRRNAAFRGIFEGSLANLDDGQYELLIAPTQLLEQAPTARFLVSTPAGELTRLAMDRRALAAAAEIARGKFYMLGEADRLIDELPRGRRLPIESLAPYEIWNRWWVLGAFLLLVICEWILRKRKGLL